MRGSKAIVETCLLSSRRRQKLSISFPQLSLKLPSCFTYSFRTAAAVGPGAPPSRTAERRSINTFLLRKAWPQSCTFPLPATKRGEIAKKSFKSQEVEKTFRKYQPKRSFSKACGQQKLYSIRKGSNSWLRLQPNRPFNRKVRYS